MYNATLPGDIFVRQTQINTHEAEVKHISSPCRGMPDPCSRIAARFALHRQILAAVPVLSGGQDGAGAAPNALPVTATSLTVTARGRTGEPHPGCGHGEGRAPRTAPGPAAHREPPLPDKAQCLSKLSFQSFPI